MKKISLTLCAFLTILSGAGFAVTSNTSFSQCLSHKHKKNQRQYYTIVHPSFDEWKASCDQLTTTHYDKSSLLTYKVFDAAIHHFLEKNRVQLQQYAWIEHDPAPSFFADVQYKPHVQKIVFKASDHLVFHGDIHGDIHSLNGFITALNSKKYMQGFTIIDPSCSLLFLGDYTDRGKHGVEVIYTILRLATENPGRVFLVRGNHEDLAINQAGGFIREIMSKFEHREAVALYDSLALLYQQLPIAVYITVDNKEFALCCHGGIEWGYDPKKLLQTSNQRSAEWVTTLKRKSAIEQMPDVKQAIEQVMATLPSSCAVEYTDSSPASACHPITNGFMWFDFYTDKQKTLGFDPRRSWILGADFTQQLLSKDNIRCVFRAHQHGDATMMSHILNSAGHYHADDTGVAKLWEIPVTAGSLLPGMVLTFSVSPHNGFGTTYGYNFDSFGVLHLADSFSHWRLNMHRIDQNGKFL